MPEVMSSDPKQDMRGKSSTERINDKLFYGSGGRFKLAWRVFFIEVDSKMRNVCRKNVTVVN